MLFCLLNAQSFLQKRLNEEIIDYDLLEDLICYVDETCGEGAILIFLPVSLFNIFLSSTTEWLVSYSLQELSFLYNLCSITGRV
jgi:hypothetical protein